MNITWNYSISNYNKDVSGDKLWSWRRFVKTDSLDLDWYTHRRVWTIYFQIFALSRHWQTLSGFIVRKLIFGSIFHYCCLDTEFAYRWDSHDCNNVNNTTFFVQPLSYYFQRHACETARLVRAEWSRLSLVISKTISYAEIPSVVNVAKSVAWRSSES